MKREMCIKKRNASRWVSMILVIVLILSICGGNAFADYGNDMTADEYILAFEEALAERDRAAILGDSKKEAIMNQVLEDMGAEELTGQEVAELLSETESASPRLAIPTEGRFKWTSTRVWTHYNGQQCQVMLVYISPIAEIDSVLINQGVLAEGDEIDYYTKETMATGALNVLSLSLNIFDQITSMATGVTIKDAAFSVADCALNLAYENIPDTAPAGTTFTYQIVNYTFMKWALVKPYETSDDSQVIQLMTSKTETHISFDMQMRYTNEHGNPDVFNMDDDFIVHHSGYYYNYPVSEIVKDYCLGKDMITSYVGYLPICVGNENHADLLIAIDSYAPPHYAAVFYDNEM